MTRVTVHERTLRRAAHNYSKNERPELIVKRTIFENAASQGDPRWKTVFTDERISIKEHLELISDALAKHPPVAPAQSVECQPGLLTGIDPRKGA